MRSSCIAFLRWRQFALSPGMVFSRHTSRMAEGHREASLMAVPSVVTLDFAGGSGHRWTVGTSVPVTHSHQSRITAKSVAQRSFRHPPASGGNVMIELREQQKKLTTNQWKLI